MRDKKQQDIYAIIERCYPLIFSMLLCVVGHFCTYTEMSDISNLLDAIINFVSILLGFLGAVLALMFSFNENSFIRYIMTDDFYKKILKHYFRSSILSGFLLVVCSVAMLVHLSITFNMIPVVKYIFNNLYYLEIFLVSYFVLSSYRIISFVLKCAFMQYDIQEETYPADKCTEEDLEKLREKCSIGSKK